MLLDEVNGYQRALQHQALEKAQFGAPHPPGFYTQVRLYLTCYATPIYELSGALHSCCRIHLMHPCPTLHDF